MRTRLLTAVAAAAVLGLGFPAQARPTPRIDAVFRAADCGGDPCDPATNPTLTQGAVATGTIQILVSAQGELRPLEWARLEAREGDDPRWICIEHWSIGDQSSFSGRYDWNTYEWPDPTVNSNCLENAPHYHGMLARNDEYRMRLVARERRVPGEPASDHEGTSAEFRIRINNPPVRPAWVAEPSVSGGGSPSVLLQWRPNVEPDLREYRIVRVGPGSQRTVLAVDANDPRRQGCSRIGDTAIRCSDDDFPRFYGGTYRYTVVAARAASAGSGSCRLSTGRCITSTPSEAMRVTVPGPTRSGEQVTAPPASPARPNPVGPAPQSGDTVPTIPGFPPPPPTGAAGAPAPIAAPAPFEALPGRGLLGPVAFAAVLGFVGWRIRRALLARR